MRLWHKDFIEALPKEQLVAQWRELSAIAGAIKKNGTPNHVLVNFVTSYPFDHFVSYAALVQKEMAKRGYRTSDSVWEKIISLEPNFELISFDKIYEEAMDKTYKNICYYNLLEKYIRGGIKESDWDNIHKYYEK